MAIITRAARFVALAIASGVRCVRSDVAVKPQILFFTRIH
jgi:hypothetical protein